MTVKIDRLRIHACHGVMQQERIVGNEFEVSLALALKPEAIRAAETDDLRHTLSYADVIAVVRREMAEPSRLLENVGWRIREALLREFPLIESGRIEIVKLMPPCGVQLAGAGIELTF